MRCKVVHFLALKRDRIDEQTFLIDDSFFKAIKALIQNRHVKVIPLVQKFHLNPTNILKQYIKYHGVRSTDWYEKSLQPY